MKQFIKRHSCAVSALAFLVPGVALAQQTAPQPDASQTVAAVDDVVVTAQRRSQRLQDVPASIEVRSSEQLRAAGVSNTIDLTLVVPGLNMSTNGANSAPTVRGISTEARGPGAENNVAIYVDGVYMPSQTGNIFDFPDIERIEVLKGPQGTLYGRNATGGALLFVTQSPSQTPHGRLALNYGRFNDRRVSGFLSGPIGDSSLSGSLSFDRREMDGFDRDVVKDEQTGAIENSQARAKLRFQPNDAIDVTGTVYYAHLFDESLYAATLINGNTVARRAFPTVFVSSEPNTTALNNPAHIENRTTGGSIKASWTGTYGTLTSITGYTNAKSHYLTDGDLTAAQVTTYDVTQNSESYIQDIYFSSDQSARLKYLIGATYFSDESTFDPLIVVGALRLNSEQTVKSISAYGEVTLDLTDRLSVVGGLRYSKDDRDLYGSGAGNGFPYIASASWDAFTPRVVATYRVENLGNVYVSYTEGFKSGLFNSSSLSPTPVDPETIKAWETGIKSNPLGQFQFNAAVFAYDYTNIQVSAIQTGVATLQNAAGAKVYGADFDVTFRPTDSLTVRGGMSYLDATYENFPNAVINIPRPAAQCPVGAYPCGNIAVSQDVEGNPLPRAPKWTANFSAQYRARMGPGEINLNGAIFWSDEFSWEPGNRVRQDPYEVVTARASWTPDAYQNLQLSLWGRNLTDSHYGQSVVASNSGDYQAYASPRTYGVSIEYAF